MSSKPQAFAGQQSPDQSPWRPQISAKNRVAPLLSGYREICGLGAGLAFLSDEQRGQLVNAAVGIRNQESKAKAIRGLAAGLLHLSVYQRSQLINAVVGLNNKLPEKAKALDAVTDGVRALELHIETGGAGVKLDEAPG